MMNNSIYRVVKRGIVLPQLQPFSFTENKKSLVSSRIITFARGWVQLLGENLRRKNLIVNYSAAAAITGIVLEAGPEVFTGTGIGIIPVNFSGRIIPFYDAVSFAPIILRGYTGPVSFVTETGLAVTVTLTEEL
jgi:hypothetical protein